MSVRDGFYFPIILFLMTATVALCRHAAVFSCNIIMFACKSIIVYQHVTYFKWQHPHVNINSHKQFGTQINS